MSNPISVVTKKVGEIIGKYESRPVVLPEFQRSFSWDNKHVTAFWTDLLAFRQSYAAAPITASYYLGSVVVLHKTDKIELLDGQQRLAMSTIVLSAIRDIAKGINTLPDNAGIYLARDIQRDLVQKDETAGVITYSLTLSELDRDYFLKTIQQETSAVVVDKLRSHRLIKQAREASIAHIKAATNGLPYDQAIAYLKSIQDALSKGMVLGQIQVQSEDDAFHIFETLNDRGLRLSVPDLVLNLLMSRAGSASDRAAVRSKWNIVVRQLGRRDIARFLRHMWVSRHGDVKGQGLYAEIKSNLIANTIKSVDFVDGCADECEIYVDLLDGTLDVEKEAKNNLVGLLSYLDAQPALPLMLAGFQTLGGKADFTKLAKAAVTHFIRHALVSNKNPLDLETAFYKAARAMRQAQANGKTGAAILAAGKAELGSLEVDDPSVELAAAELELERSEAVWLMTEIANSMQTATKEIAVNKANLEHIFPQNPTATDWPNMAELEPLLWHVGNLTILGERLNQKAQNKSFGDKKVNHYAKSELLITQELTTEAAWSEAAVKARAKKLAKKIVQRWRYN